jgi:hypothetical protein
MGASFGRRQAAVPCNHECTIILLIETLKLEIARLRRIATLPRFGDQVKYSLTKRIET